MSKAPISYKDFNSLYSGILLFNLLVVSALGIYPSAKAFLEKREFLSELSAKNKEFTVVLEAADEKESIYREIEPYLPALNSAVPDSLPGDRIIKDVLLISAKQGFSLKDISFISREAYFTTVNISVEGEFENLNFLLRDLENADLSIAVESVKVEFPRKGRDSEEIITFRVKVFNLNLKKLKTELENA